MAILIEKSGMMSYKGGRLFNKAALPLWAFNALSVFFICLLASCEKPNFEDLEESENGTSEVKQASLTVKTRTSEETEKVSYPVRVYVMNDKGTCVDMSQLDSSSDILKFSLDAGSYDIYAIGGADEDSYELPSKDKATQTSQIALRDGATQGDLMASNNHITLTKGEKNNLVLAMTRKVSKIESIKIENIPSDVTAVEVTISPLVKYIQLDGSNSEESSYVTFPLSPTSTSGTWSNNTGIYITESTSNITIKVGVTVSGSKESYSCSYGGKVNANHKLTINGKFNDNTVALSGVLTGAKWGDPMNIDFEINGETTEDNGGSSNDNDDSDSGSDSQDSNAPGLGALYDNCVVIKSVRSGSSTTNTLMTLDEYNKLSYSKSQKGKDNSKFQAAISECVESTLAFYDDDQLLLPTLEELKYVYDNIDAINKYIDNINTEKGREYPDVVKKAGSYYCGYYYRADDGNIYVYTIDGQTDEEPNPNRATYKVRGFKTVTFTN